MSSTRPLVLIDATPLSADSGFRGIGRYIRDLLYGLSATESAWCDHLRIGAIEELSLAGRFRVNEDLVAAADATFAARGSEGAGLKYARRLLLGRAVEHARAALLHITEAVGTPLSCKVPRLVTCHDMIELRYPEHYMTGPVGTRIRLEREKVRFARPEHVVAISQRTADDVIAIAGAKPERVHVILHGVELEAFADGAEAEGDAAKLRELGVGATPYVFYAGGADWRKNVGGMLRALAIARRSAEVELVWAGALAPRYVRMVEKAAREAGVEHHVRLLGFVDESHMPALFRHAAAHLFLSRLEGFGLSVVEAMAAGCPVIVAEHSCSDEIAGDAGVVVDADDVESAGRAIATFVRDPEARARQAALGRARVPYFDRKRMARDYAELYATLVRG